MNSSIANNLQECKGSKHAVIYGPTASGKSRFAMEYAAKNNGVILNFDSQQIYREIPIITAQPTKEDMAEIEHKLYGHVDYGEDYNMNRWLFEAKEQIQSIIDDGKNVIAVGGTGLYLSILLEGAIKIPKLDSSSVEGLKNKYSSYSTIQLYEKLLALDPKYASVLNKQDRQRIFRALSFCEITDKRYSDFRSGENTKDFYLQGLKFQKIYIKPPREELYKAINKRFLDMIRDGAIEEVRELCKKYPQNDFKKSTGVLEIVSYIKGEMKYEDAISISQQKTRNYAKRQYTWFNNRVNFDEIIEKIM